MRVPDKNSSAVVMPSYSATRRSLSTTANCSARLRKAEGTREDMDPWQSLQPQAAGSTRAPAAAHEWGRRVRGWSSNPTLRPRRLRSGRAYMRRDLHPAGRSHRDTPRASGQLGAGRGPTTRHASGAGALARGDTESRWAAESRLLPYRAARQRGRRSRAEAHRGPVGAAEGRKSSTAQHASKDGAARTPWQSEPRHSLLLIWCCAFPPRPSGAGSRLRPYHAARWRGRRSRAEAHRGPVGAARGR